MEKESSHGHQSDQMTPDQHETQQFNSASQSFQCNYCILIFKSKQFLHEHVSRVHGFIVNAPQGEAESTPSKTATPTSKPTFYSDYSRDLFACRHCAFTSYSWTETLNHEKRYHKTPSGKGSVVKTQSKATLKKNAVKPAVSPLKQGGTGKVNSTSSISTSKTKSSHLFLNNLGRHIGSSGNTSQSTLKLPRIKLKSPKQDSDVQVLMKSDNNNLHSCMLCSFSSCSLIVLRSHEQEKHGNSSNMCPSLGSPTNKLKDAKPEMYSSSFGSSSKTASKRTHDDSSLFPAKKKLKVDTSSPESTVIKSKASRNSSFNYEVRENEDANFGEKSDDHLDFGNGESSDESDKLYCCKHCDYSHKSSRGVSSHYQKMHPYIRYTFKYILDQKDRSATYRCLECPVEFAALDDLKKHYDVYHPKAPDVFIHRADQLDLVFKCFLCPYTSPKRSFLKVHYRREHAKEEINNPLMSCSYTSNNTQKKSSQSLKFTSTSSLNSAISPKKTQAPNIDISRLSPLNPSPVSNTVDEGMHHCKHCSFSNKSVVAMLVHYQKKHPSSGATIDQIKQASASTFPTADDQIQHVSPFKLTNSSLKTSNDAQEDLNKMFFCQVCNYRHPSVKGVFTHQKKNHCDLNATALQIQFYTAEVRRRFKKSFIPKYGSTSPGPGVPTGLGNFYFCQLCNYGHPTVRGVLNHQRVRHKNIKGNSRLILRHTMELCEKTLTSVGEVSSNPFALPLPIVEKGTEKMNFCQLCNYSHSTVKAISNHQSSKHPTTKASAQEIRKYTAYVHEQTGKPQLVNKELPNSSTKSLPHIRSLKCSKCHYTTPNLYLLKRHLMKNHQMKVKMSEVVNSAYRDGLLEPGYHCQWCVYSHPEANSIRLHCLKRHPHHHPGGVSLEHITSDLYAGPKVPQSMKIGHDSKSIIKDEHTSQKVPRECVKAIPSQKQGEKMAKVYPCRACPFKSSTIASIKRHYRAVHPWSVKEDGSVLDVISSRQPPEIEQNQANVHNDMPGSFESYQEPVDDSEELEEGISGHSSHKTITSSRMFKCSVCSTVFSTHHGLMTHCGRKHPDHKLEQETEYEVVSSDTQTSVYKCELCSYVNSRSHGVLTHCQMKHPSFKARAEKLQTKIVQFPNMDQCFRKRSGRITLHGHLCKLCPVAHASLKKMKVHYESCHKRSASTKAVKQANVIKKHLLSKYRGTQGSIAQAAICNRKMKCHRCMFSCSSMKILASHIHSSHSSSAEYTYTCSLCTYSSLMPVYLGNHYRRMHGPTAYRTYFASTYASLTHKQSPDVCQSNPTEGSVQCKKCTKLYFKSPLLLSIHYTNVHFNEMKQDFTILSRTVGNEMYQCGHCNIAIQGNQELSSHLHHHAELFQKSLKPMFEEQQPRLKPVKPKSQELPEILTIQELARWNVTKVETFTLEISPESSPSRTPELVDIEMGAEEAEGFPCDQCGRSFMSLKGLRSHERSHAAMASFKRLGSLPKHIFEEHISYRPGTMKPYHCGLCAYRTNLVILMKNHLYKKHEAEYPDKDSDILVAGNKDMDNSPRASEEVLNPSGPQEGDCMTEPVLTQKRGYSEPTHVQRQLNHYKQIAQRKGPATEPPSTSRPVQDGLFHCEFCNFTTGHISSVRRHYLNRHNGKRLLRCKDCSFFTCFRKRFDMHMEAGGSSCLPEAPKDLRCPLCLYHSKNKNNMIDHIILHREERTVPIEVRRTKLSHYLKDVVFRCHKCTFSSASDENLRLHMLKHDDIKPYKCRLCFFDCTQLSDLEAHLCDKHQVMRNHELVGHVNLEQLETRLDKVNEEEKGNCNVEPGNSDGQDHDTNHKHEQRGEQSGGFYHRQRYDMQVENITKHDKLQQHQGLDLRGKDMKEQDGREEDVTKPNDTLQQHQGPDLHGKDMEEQHEREKEVTGLNGLPGNRWQETMETIVNHHDKKVEQNSENQKQSEEFGMMASVQMNVEERTGPNNGAFHEKQESSDIEPNCESDEKQGQKTKLIANCHNIEKLIHEVTVKRGTERNKIEQIDQYGDMPILENVYHKEEKDNSLSERQEEELSVKQDKLDKCNETHEQMCEETFHEEQNKITKKSECSREGRIKENDIASGLHDSCISLRMSQLTGIEKPFCCNLCGRTLTNSTDFECHVMRHGM